MSENVTVPKEVLDLVRFLANTWSQVDKFVYENCDGETLCKYPVVQGTSNQIKLSRIGEQKYDNKNIMKAVEWMLSTENNGEEKL